MRKPKQDAATDDTGPVQEVIDATEDSTVPGIKRAGIEVTKGSRLGDDWREVPYDAATKEMVETLFKRFGAQAVKKIARQGRCTLGQIVEALGG